MTLLRFSVAAALVVALASAAPAQTVEDWTKNWNTHTLAEVIKPLDDLVPQDLGPDSTANLPDWIDTETAPQALPAEGADRAALAALFGETGATPVTAPAPAPTIAAIPDDWVTYTPLGTRFRLPPDWALVAEEGGQAMYFKGDLASKLGLSFGVSLVRDFAAQVAAEPSATMLPDVTFAQGQVFHRVAIRMESQPGVTGEFQALYSDLAFFDDQQMMIGMVASGTSFADNAKTFEMILSSFEPPLPPAPPVQALEPVLHGLIPYPMPKGYSLMEGGTDQDFYTTISDVYDKMILFAMGDRVSGPTGWLAAMPAGTTGETDSIMGQPARRFEWISSTPDVYENGVVVPAHNKMWLLDDCAPQGQRVGVSVWGVTAFVEGTEPGDILNSLKLAAPLIPCVTSQAAPQTPPPTGPQFSLQPLSRSPLQRRHPLLGQRRPPRSPRRRAPTPIPSPIRAATIRFIEMAATIPS